jgi:hypothetical protein
LKKEVAKLRREVAAAESKKKATAKKSAIKKSKGNSGQKKTRKR